jgi:hypothetical protein
VPLQALAKGRVVLSFEEKKEASLPDLSMLANDSNIQSTTGQLQWHTGGKGYFTINTNGTAGVVGFLPKQPLPFDHFALQSANPFAVILINSLDKNKGIGEAKRILITTVARARNTGMKYNEAKTELLDVGKPPILLEPVSLLLNWKKKERITVHVLDHTGHRTGKTVALKNGKMTLDGAKHKTIYYEIVRE